MRAHDEDGAVVRVMVTLGEGDEIDRRSRGLVIPMFAYAFSFRWLGFYLATIAYMAFFAAYLGRYKWWGVLLAATITPLAMYLLFEVAFRLILPKSIFYTMGFPL